MMLSIMLLVLLIIINGVFSATELAFLSLDRIQLKKEIDKGNKKAIKIDRILSKPSVFLSTIQIGITLAGFLASAFAADYFANYLLDIINISFLSYAMLKNVLLVVITVILSYFTLVFGELVPKKLAINKPFEVACLFVNLIDFVRIIFYPLVKLLTLSNEVICKILNIKENDNNLTEEDIKKMILLGRNEGILEEKEKEYILNIFEFNDVDVEKVMTPKSEVSYINIDEDLKAIIGIIKKEKFSRFPVYQNNKDNVIGVLNVKDLILKYRYGHNLTVRELLRPVSKFEYNTKIDDVFRHMQIKNESLSIICKAGKVLGIVTVEDAVEEIVGNIYDEYDE